MLKLRKRLFLILSMVGVILCLVSCIPDGYIKLKFDEELYTIKVGEKLDFMPTVVKDSHESNYELVYESSEQTVATYIDGILTGLKEGTTELKVFVKDNPSVYATTTIQVVYTETLDVEFDVKDKMLKGQTYKISYVLQEGCIDPIITYRSNDDKILTVDNDGYVLAVSKGTTQIIARVTSSVDGIQYREYVFDVTVLEEIYEIEYVLDGGINHPNNPTSYTDSDLPVGLNNPSKTGYTFDGWYLDAECTGNKITELDASMSGKVTLYAKWIATKYTIDYQLDGGLNHPG
ncbi:MAG: InlB B-repeat-containing protein [Christensenellales bacterium]